MKIGDRTWAELRGFWDVENDFMGGPFVSYSTLDEATGRVLTIDGYVYSPKLSTSATSCARWSIWST